MLQLNERYYKKSAEENKYTSTGIKFWRHPDALKAYKNQQPQTVISTHIAPEGHCNLKCSYCSVSKCKVNERIELSKIKNYVTTLKRYGLKAVILTGGGEPTLYPQFNELVHWLAKENLSVALITNSMNIDKVDSDLWKIFHIKSPQIFLKFFCRLKIFFEVKNLSNSKSVVQGVKIPKNFLTFVDITPFFDFSTLFELGT